MMVRTSEPKNQEFHKHNDPKPNIIYVYRISSIKRPPSFKRPL